MSIHTLSNMDCNFNSYQKLIFLYKLFCKQDFSSVNISIEKWFAANLSSPLGGVLDIFQDNFNEIDFHKISRATKTILQKNQFLSHYGFKTVEDVNHTTIPYQKLNPQNSRFFYEYVMGNLLQRSDLSGMGHAAKKKVAESIYEIFENARLHSESEYIYTCGQFFPAKHSLLFTITDTGVGFKNRINERFNKELPSTKAIKWAMGEGNSTKLDIPGGIGLAILKDFTSQNGGKIQIVSGDGFYESSSQGSKTRSFDGVFPGTIVNVEFKTNDHSSYSFFTDIDDDLF